MAIGTWFTVSTRSTVSTGSLTQFYPSLFIIVRYKPVSVINLQFRSNTVSSRSTGRTFCTLIRLSLHLVTRFVGQPVTVYGPVIDTVGILLHTDNWRMSVGTVCTVVTCSTVLTVVDVYRTTLQESKGMTNFLTTVVNRTYTGNIIVFLQCSNDSLHSHDVLVHFVALSLQSLERCTCWQFDDCTISQDKLNKVCIGCIDALEDRITVLTRSTWLSISTRLTISTRSTVGTWLTIFTGSLAQFYPATFCTVVIRYEPISVFNLELRSNTVLTWSTRYTGRTFATSSLSRNLVACFVGQPITVYGPVIDTIGILLHTDNRCYTVCTIRTCSTVLTMINIDRTVLQESKGITYFYSVLHDRSNASNIVVFLQSSNHSLQ